VPRKLQCEWDDANTDHISRHGVSREEAEEVLSGDPLILDENQVGGEPRTVCLGRTEHGRVLILVYAARLEKVRVVTAYAVPRKLRRLYGIK
jgi:uncharacterized protein